MVIQVTLLAEEWTQSTKGDSLSTINRQLAIHLSHQRGVKVTLFIPMCSQEDKQDAGKYGIRVVEAEEHLGLDPVFWLGFPPEGFSTDFIIGHDVELGWQGKAIRRACGCKWIHVVHSNAEEMGSYKNNSGAISNGQDKHEIEVKLCEHADMAVAVGPKLKDSFTSSLSFHGKDVLNLTPGIFDEFSDVPQKSQDSKFNILVVGQGDCEDFELKGFDVAAKAVAGLKDSTYRLIVVGAPVGRQEELAEKLSSLGISPSQLAVRRFNKDRIQQMAKLFSEVDLLLMPSATEGFGLAALEALSAGLPFLVSSNSGFAEALKDVPHGFECIVEAEEDWPRAIKRARNKKPEIRQDEAEMLRKVYNNKYPWKEQCAALVKKMQSMCSGATKKAGAKKTKADVNPSDAEEKKAEGRNY